MKVNLNFKKKKNEKENNQNSAIPLVESGVDDKVDELLEQFVHIASPHSNRGIKRMVGQN